MPAIQIDNLSKRYGTLQALDDVSFSIEQGEFFGLLGPNGAGKTTLISIMSGIAKASSGSVKILGEEVAKNPLLARRNLGVVPQEIAFDPFFTVRETLRLQSGYFGIKNNDDWIDEIVENLDLTDKADANMRALSGGMKRRVLVAQALVHRPPVIVLDEPTAGVDVGLRQALWKFIQRLNDEGHTIVLTTHYLEEAETLCNRIAMLKNGRIEALDTTAALLERFSGTNVVLLLNEDRLPQSLHALVTDKKTLPTGAEYTLHLKHLADVERVLAQLRQENITVHEMQLQQTDLEQVFLQVMDKAGSKT